MKMSFLEYHVKVLLSKTTSPRPSEYFGILNFFFPDSKISLSTRNVFKSNSPVHAHPMVSGFTLKKLRLHVVPPYWFIVR